MYSATNDSSSSPSVTAPLNGGQAAPVSAPDGSVQNAAAKVLPSVVKIGVMTSQGAATGSGIVISKDGLIVTNNHVVASGGNGGKISVMLNDGRTVSATIVGTDPLTDLAVIKASANDLKLLPCSARAATSASARASSRSVRRSAWRRP